MTANEAFVRSGRAAEPRTLIDVLDATIAAHPDALAIDDGQDTLTYSQLADKVREGAAALAAAGLRRGDRVGVRIPSGTAELYTAILAVLAAGAAYVPVDVDDPDERARTVFAEAGVSLILTEGDLASGLRRAGRAAEPADAAPVRPDLENDAWIIFTSGSTGTPKGVAVTHRSAAAFVDAESRLFLQEEPLGPGDRVLAGLSVAFDASCEEMWLAWRYGACLVPAPRALVRTGMDLGPWLVSQGITVISTVPTLAGLWAAETLEGVRLLIFGGEACPPELAARLATDGREVWNTYGPTEATVVACAAILDGSDPVRIGLPLDGWDLAVVGPDGEHVAEGESGELIIGGVGLARYLDGAKDAEKYAPAPQLGWDRAYRTGDMVRYETEGLVFIGRVDDQVKIGGRRIELGEIDAALSALPGVASSAVAVRKTGGGAAVLVGYLAPHPGASIDTTACRAQLAEQLPAALVPLLAVMDELPTRGSGKVDRDALPWPLAQGDDAPAAEGLTPTEEWVAERWTSVLGASVSGPDDDFFLAGGGSLLAAQLVSALRGRYPTVTVADVYETPRLGDLAARLDELEPAPEASADVPPPVRRTSQLIQLLLTIPLSAVVGLRWLTWTLLGALVAHGIGLAPWLELPAWSWAWALAGWAVFISPFGRMGTTLAVARATVHRLKPGRYRRGGRVHLRLWFAEAWAEAAGAGNLSCAPWNAVFARALGAKVGKNVDLHTQPPITGLLTLGNGCAIEPEVDLAGHRLEGDTLVVGRIRVDRRANVGTRSTLGPGSRVGQEAQVAPGSVVFGDVPPGELWAGSPATFRGTPRKHWPAQRAARGRRWVGVYGASAAVLSALPSVALIVGLVAVLAIVGDAPSLAAGVTETMAWSWLGGLIAFVVLAAATWVGVRLLSIGLHEGYYPVRSRGGWQAWAVLRLMDDARRTLFPLYASSVTPFWLRSLGARIGRDVEASTALMIPTLTTVGEGAFLADDTLVGSYELGRGWMRIDTVKVGKRAFLGNSGMIFAGRAVPKHGLVAVLSATPRKAKKGSSWLGSPPEKLRRVEHDMDSSLTYDPPAGLRVARATIEALRLVPVMASFALGLALALTLHGLVVDQGVLVALALAPWLVIAASVLSWLVAAAMKWLLVGRIAKDDHPLWSSFVWRNELADTFVEAFAVPWLMPGASGSPILPAWLRTLGARIGKGAWVETYWLPEADLITVGDGANVERGCVLQTHLFHDRVMSLDTVTVGAGATMGPHGVILPAAGLGDGTEVGPGSLVLRGDLLPAGSRWTGNPVEPADA
ncbi:Pls/PosA family non-ribosomal peptide synthetase [Demequina pelophila]|uniref:Pls/PosA family non-ribosomal peptide synthetase n=1 Tax=Demequina pelophila TaxID=1638984 RepID=UPI0009E4C3A3|nr:Pls/PosA family non-ribosomal peptide synthetase [Demequina pelophila]